MPTLTSIWAGRMSAVGACRQDYVEAHKWMNLAASRDSGDFQKRIAAVRDDLEKLMTPAQVADAQARAREWMEAFQRLNK